MNVLVWINHYLWNWKNQGSVHTVCQPIFIIYIIGIKMVYLTTSNTVDLIKFLDFLVEVLTTYEDSLIKISSFIFKNFKFFTFLKLFFIILMNSDLTLTFIKINCTYAF